MPTAVVLQSLLLYLLCCCCLRLQLGHLCLKVHLQQQHLVYD